MAELPDLLQQFSSRYRRALAVKGGVLAALGISLVAALAWRLHGTALPVVWRAGFPALAAVLGIALMVWWRRRCWIPAGAAIGRLDQALGLQQRLVTAAEFAARPEQPALYDALLKDAAQRFSSGAVPMPRPVGRTAAGLAAALALLLFWPGRRMTPAPSAGQPHPPSASPKAPNGPPQAGAADAQMSGSGGAASGGLPQPSPSASSASGASPSTASGTAPASAAPSGREASSPSAPPQPAGGSSGAPRQAGTAASAAASAQRPDGRSSQPQPDARADRAGASRALQGAGGDGGVEPRSGAATAQASKAHGGGAPAVPDPQVTKAQIQQLLKEVSGELQALQAQLAQNDQPRPEPGGGTDPQLYGGAEPLEPLDGSGGALPVQVEGDQAGAASSPRRGGGVGEPSGDVVRAAPRMAPEDAALSSTPLEDPSQARQPVPPDYQGAFDRLRQQRGSSATQASQ